MAETNVTGQDASLKYEKQDSSCLVSGLLDDASLSDFFSRLHENLDFYQLFNTFINELRATVPCDSIAFENKSMEISLVNGSAGRHHCEYTLKYEGLSLGKIRITRDSKLLDQELDIIETMLAGLTLPLRNALRYQQAIRFSLRDELTGLRNESYYHDIVDLEIKRSHRYKNPFSLLMFDLDDFENINAQYGREAGDAILHQVAGRIGEKARSSDVVYRNGGDQFLVFLPNTDKAEAMVVATRIKDFALARTCKHEDKLISFTLSVGVVTVTHGDTVDKLIDRADKATFHAKILGKDRIYADSFTDDVHTGQV
ncbi:MAG: GGDEF domain-containing protein [Gammaproteobacteria bacterium]